MKMGAVGKLVVVGVAATTSEVTNPAANAVDGKTTTRWSALGPGAALTLDLGSDMAVSSVAISWYLGDTRKSSFYLDASTDGVVFNAIYSGQSTGKTAALETYRFTEISARFIRITVAGNTQNRWASISEVEIYGRTPPLFSDAFTGPDKLITNEYAYWNPSHSGIVVSPSWEMNSGSLFVRSGTAWSGAPDDIAPNAASSNGTDSAVFRMMTKRADFGDVAVSFRLRNNRLVTTKRTPAVDWDGVHVWMRYQAENWLYYASINRRDNTVVIKKKVPGGPTNGGTYYILASPMPYKVPYGTWQRVRATTRNNSDGSVAISLYANDILLINAIDKGLHEAPIRNPGKTGLRGDNCDFNFDDFAIDSL